MPLDFKLHKPSANKEILFPDQYSQRGIKLSYKSDFKFSENG